LKSYWRIKEKKWKKKTWHVCYTCHEWTNSPKKGGTCGVFQALMMAFFSVFGFISMRNLFRGGTCTIWSSNDTSMTHFVIFFSLFSHRFLHHYFFSLPCVPTNLLSSLISFFIG
jgi:hypothetical protein